jgi:hypothetical protein
MTQRHRLDRSNVDLIALREQLSTRLGQPVELITREPDPDTGAPGELIAERRDTNEWLDVDPALVAELVATAAERTPAVSAEERARNRFDAATTIPEKLAAFRGYLGERIDEQQRRRQIRRTPPPR